MEAGVITVKEYSISEVANMEQHAELINGTLVIESKTSTTHNRIVSVVSSSLRDYIKNNNGNCEVFTDTVGLYCNELCNDKSFFMPDIMVVCDIDGIQEDGVHISPLFVAEVVSEATKQNDYGEKMITYRKMGVKEYWVIDPQRKVVNKYLLENQYAPETYMYPEAVGVSVYKGLYIDLSQFMR